MAHYNGHHNHIMGSRTIAIVAGIIILILGLVFLFFPIKSAIFIQYLIIIGLFLYGVYRIINYFNAPAGHRDGWQLAMGIVFVVSCSVVLLMGSPEGKLMSFAFLLSFLALMAGMNQIISYGALKGMPGAGFILASGIVNVLLAAFLIFSPFMSVTILAMVQGVYLCVTGVSLIIEGIAKHEPTFFDEILKATAGIRDGEIVIEPQDVQDTIVPPKPEETQSQDNK